ncbi:glycosyltransferase family 2 protein [Paenibacillus oryzisoli]|uniref:glycosyltransferase n=1 Tax=Paenibacillus oryzisoli TaxID=1850517 RepID=UPI003D2BBD86
MKKKPIFSIIMATYNSEKYIEVAIQSVVNQSFDKYELIIVDGGSSDKTLEIVAKYANHINKTVSERDHGIYDAFNKGVRMAEGEFIYFLNSDDYFYDNQVLAVVAEKIASSDFDFVYGLVEGIDENLNFRYTTGKPMTIEDFKAGQTYPHQGFFARRSLFEEYGSFDEKYVIVADLDFMIKCFLDEKKTSLYIDKIITCFRLGGTSNDYSSRQQTILEAEIVLDKHFKTGISGKKKQDINPLYRKWFESQLLFDKGISTFLEETGVKAIAIFGAMKTGLYILSDCKKYSTVHVECFLDNNDAMQGQELQSVHVYSPKWLKENATKIDAIIISIEGNHEEAITQQIEQLCVEPMKVYSWKELVHLVSE